MISWELSTKLKWSNRSRVAQNIYHNSCYLFLWITPLPFTHARNFLWQVSSVHKRRKPGYIQRPFPRAYAAHKEWNSSEFNSTYLHITRGFCYCEQHDAVNFVDVLLISHSQFTPGFHLINGVRHKREILNVKANRSISFFALSHHRAPCTPGTVGAWPGFSKKKGGWCHTVSNRGYSPVFAFRLKVIFFEIA